MEAYGEFAHVYDQFMEDVPYEAWCGFIETILRERGLEDGLVLDLGCGTGSLTRLLRDAGYDMIGVDSSVEMLEVAKSRGDEGILYLAQDMREFELYGTVRAVVSTCDCINYVLEKEELTEVFSLVNNYLDPGGLFFFDFNTRAKYESLGDAVIAENQEDASFIWENFYYPEERINEYDVTFFLREEGELFRKVVEEHFQRAYELSEIRECLTEAGMEFVAAYEDYSLQEAGQDSQRICVLAREHGKTMGERSPEDSSRE